MQNLINSLNALNVYQFQSESMYADYDAQRNLNGRTNYVNAETLKYFKSRILRAKASKNGLYYVIQESLPHPDFEMKRVRRNIVFNVFGTVIGEWRDACYTSAKRADETFFIALSWCDSSLGVADIHLARNNHISKLERQLNTAKESMLA